METARIVVPGYPHYVTQRGVRSAFFLQRDEDWRFYLKFTDHDQARGLGNAAEYLTPFANSRFLRRNCHRENHRELKKKKYLNISQLKDMVEFAIIFEERRG